MVGVVLPEPGTEPLKQTLWPNPAQQLLRRDPFQEFLRGQPAEGFLLDDVEIVSVNGTANPSYLKNS